MDILLINPPWRTKNGNIWHGVRSTSPPLGLLYVAAYAEKHGASVRVMDVHAEALSFEDIEQVVRDTRPTWVGFTAVTAQIKVAHRIVDIIKKVSPETKIVVGGVHASVLPDEVLLNPHVDFCIRGEGEKSMFDLVDGQPLESIGGLSYRGDNPLMPIEHNKEAEPIEDLDSLPTPAYHLVPFEVYRPAVGAYRRLPSINMTMTRGCPGKCTFCNSAETALRTRSAKHVVDEIQFLQRRYGVREVSFYDDTFTIYKQNVMEFCDLVVERKMDLTWSCFARTDCVSPSLLRKMKKAGCHQILFGVESADPEILKTIRKPIDIQQTRVACKMVQKAGISVRAAFMFGNPGETVESLRRTIDFAISLNPDLAIFNITTPYPGTQMFDWAKREGYLRTLDWDDYDLANSVMELPTITNQQIDEMYKVAYREFYFRPAFLVRRVLKMRTFTDLRENFRAFRSVFFAKGTGPRKHAVRTEAGPVKERIAAEVLRPTPAPEVASSSRAGS